MAEKLSTRERFLQGASTFAQQSIGADDDIDELDSLQDTTSQPVDSDPYDDINRIKGAFLIPPDRLQADPDQPRKKFDQESIERLAQSFKERGQLQPIRVRREETTGQWLIVAGERRWRAALLAGLPVLMAIEDSAAKTPEEILEDQLVENCLREDLKPIDQARAFRRLMDRREWSQTQLADSLHVAKGTVSKAMVLLDLPEEVQLLVNSERFAAVSARELLRLADPDLQIEIARQVVDSDLTQKEVTALVDQYLKKNGTPSSKAKPKPKPKSKKEVYTVPGGMVIVDLEDPGSTRQMILVALKSAVSQVQREAKAEEQSTAA